MLDYQQDHCAGKRNPLKILVHFATMLTTQCITYILFFILTLRIVAPNQDLAKQSVCDKGYHHNHYGKCVPIPGKVFILNK